MDLSQKSEQELLELFRQIISLPGQLTPNQWNELKQINEEFRKRIERAA